MHSMVSLLLVLLTVSPFADAVQSAYSQQDAPALRNLLQRADSRADSLLVRYRLYPLTEDASVLEGLPPSLPNENARELALLSGLWAYRAGEASIFSAIRYGRRSASLLEQAKAIDNDAPFVLLVEGQSLLFRPAIAGRNPEAAAERFGRLLQGLDTQSVPGITPTEARAWQWLALREAGRDTDAESVRARLAASDLPPLYREFLNDPPDV